MSTLVRVLVVDDDRGARALHAGFVAATPGFVVTGTAATGTDALRLAADADLVLLDMRLPDISGIEVLHRLRTMAGPERDVLVISSSRDQTTVRQAMAGRVVGYLVKPFTKEALQERLAHYAATRTERPDDAEPPRQVPLGQGEIDRLFTGGIRTARRASGRGAPGMGALGRGAPGQGALGRGTSDPGTSGPGAPASLPKGLAATTLDRVIAALDPVTAMTAADVAAACGLSSATAHRYLAHLVETGAADLAHRYGRRGRPQVLYRLTPDATPLSDA
ncbi:MAG: response regulator [Candidatus Microbacterium phytovorans]|uniref:Response regulator n=1 Tax=Candidatus Microbacterium phytovorans TaxID=3121374 RepID=A0AAJ6B1L1_9MICO|nr:response regulator [Microbacterium sp.]WEK12348.1 MAG: response regulator [Microbacterium sp.]